MGLQGVQGRWGGRQRGRRLPEDRVDAGRGLGVGFLKAAEKQEKRQKSAAGTDPELWELGG